MSTFNASHYSGIHVPLITPFDSDLEIDWAALKRLVALHARAGVAGFVPCGSTGEASTLSMEEHKAVISFVVEEASKHGDFKVIAATGSNSTRECRELTAHAMNAGASACLVVTPYYVRPNMSGLNAHYSEIADVGIDIFLYNVPQRTGTNLSVDDVWRLHSSIPRIVGIKEATGDINQLIDLADRFADSDSFTILSGEDSLLFDCLAHGGSGSICAAALVYPDEILQLYSLMAQGNFSSALALNRSLRPRVKTLFCESNPVAIKEAMHVRFGTPPFVRPPLGAASEQTCARIQDLRLPREKLV